MFWAGQHIPGFVANGLKRQTGLRSLRAWALGLGGAGLVGCAGYERFVRDVADMPPTQGTVQAWGATGVEQFQVDACSSGAREGFYGITLHSADRRLSVRFVHNPVGPMTVAVNTPLPTQTFASIRCSAVEASLRPTGVSVNHVPVLTGEVRFACEGLRGSAIFTCS